MRQAGLFVFAEVADLGIVLQWDKGTRVILKADPKWKGRVIKYSEFAFISKATFVCEI